MSSVAALQPEIWTASSNDALQMYITENGAATNFKPSFTYPIFGDSETIFGYKDLTIFLCFDHCTFLPFLNVKYLEKLDKDDIVDPKLKLLEYLPESTVFKDEEKWIAATEEEQKEFKIPGKMLQGLHFQSEGDDFAIYVLDKHSSEALELHKRLQILVLLFIEAGSYIDISDELWDIYVLYKVTDTDTPSVVGFCTAYNYWKYPGAENFDNGVVTVRKKVSQFILLPPYQGLGLGGKFYSILYNEWLKDEKIVEILVEDPNEQFDDLRDRTDLAMIASAIDPRGDLKVSQLTSEWIEKTRLKYKLESRQFSRLLEMLLLKDNNNSKKEIRLFVKQRIYRINKEALEGLDKPTLQDKLQTAYQLLEEDYFRILKPVKFKRANGTAENNNGKRRNIEESS